VGGVSGAHRFLVGTAIISAAAVLELPLLLRRSRVAILLAALTLLALPAETAYAFKRLFSLNATAGRPISVDQSGLLEWIDRALGPAAEVSMFPYPINLGDYTSNVIYWWDLEFWNRSVTRTIEFQHRFEWTPSTFPKQQIRFNPQTGLANLSPPGYLAQAVSDTRFQIPGTVKLDGRGNVFLVDPMQPWRASWVSHGLYDDGWTKPHQAARIRVFGYPGQHGAVLRTVRIYLQAPPAASARRYTLSSNSGRWTGTVANQQPLEQQVTICVPANRYAELRLTTPQHSRLSYGDENTLTSFRSTRQVGLLVNRIDLAGAVDGSCKPDDG